MKPVTVYPPDDPRARPVREILAELIASLVLCVRMRATIGVTGVAALLGVASAVLRLTGHWR